MASHGPGATPGAGSGLYDLLGLAPGVSDEAIRSAVTEQRRAWRRRTASPEIEVRHEAERRMQQLDEAERTLLDPARRRAYDAKLPAREAPPHAVRPKAASEPNWLVRAVQQMEAGHHDVATFSARHAVEADPENPYAWAVLADAASGAADHRAAMEAIERALHLDAENAELHLKRGRIFAAAGEPDRALAAYRAAAGLDPRNMVFQRVYVGALSKHGRLDAAIAVAEGLYQSRPDDGDARVILAQAIADRAAAGLHELPDGRLLVSSLAQASYVEALSNRGLSVQAPDPVVNDELNGYREHARAARRRRFSVAALQRNFRKPLGAGIICLAAVALIPQFTGGVLAFLVVAAVLAVFVAVVTATCFEPAYKRSAQLLESVVPRRRARGPEEPDGSR